jgi:hypothetical protein
VILVSSAAAPIWWGEAPERPNVVAERSALCDKRRNARPVPVPSRGLALGHGSARFFGVIARVS